MRYQTEVHKKIIGRIRKGSISINIVIDLIQSKKDVNLQI